ncbi:hypothetical protein BDB01DRAFT_847592 [Pilobolus umbonatus]|nr:hypothetical protein BDB01DRAFT_847592 [Pilobolus umbonatus]
MLPSKPIAIPGQTNNELSYREIIKQLAAQTTTKPYGDIPPMMNKQKKKKPKNKKRIDDPPVKEMRRMSHVEDWITVDSKESLPDEEELVQSPFKNFLSADFFTEILPLHMPPPSLSEIYKDEVSEIQTADEALLTELEEEEEDLRWKSDGEDDDISSSSSNTDNHKDLLRRHSVSSFTKSSPTSSATTTASYAVSSSPPLLSNTDHELWKETIAKLKRTLIVSPPKSVSPTSSNTSNGKNKKRTSKLIPMPIPPRRPPSQRRRSEATTQPRFNPDTNTYTRDTRSNPDHLRMISAELNMMRERKLLSPLKPRGFLPRRKDPFVRGERRKPSSLSKETVI